MSGPIKPDDIDAVIHERVRLAIVSALAVAPELSFNELKEMLSLSDGNLSAHARTLDQTGYITIEKTFQGRRPHTTMRHYVAFIPGNGCKFHQMFSGGTNAQNAYLVVFFPEFMGDQRLCFPSVCSDKFPRIFDFSNAVMEINIHRLSASTLNNNPVKPCKLTVGSKKATA